MPRSGFEPFVERVLCARDSPAKPQPATLHGVVVDVRQGLDPIRRRSEFLDCLARQSTENSAFEKIRMHTYDAEMPKPNTVALVKRRRFLPSGICSHAIAVHGD
jgi:hypothetical protein